MYISVAVFAPLRQTLDYACDNTNAEPGCRVLVNLGRRKCIGLIIEANTQPSFDPKKIKPIIALIDERPILSSALLELCRFASDYYQHPLGETFAAALPNALRGEQHPDQPYYWQRTAQALPKKLSVKQQESLSLIENTICDSSTLLAKGIGSRTLKALEISGLIERRIYEDLPKIPAQIQRLSFNQEQLAAFEAAKSSLDKFAIHLVEGVTGSGKTEIYIQLCHEVLLKNQQVLIIVPEISLTPQLLERFEARFGANLCTSFHSQLNDQERLTAWEKAKHGIARIIIGTRSAIFCELKSLGLIIIDEEHDASLKQQDHLKYSARDLACVRAKQESLPLLLGSATPSFETLHNALQGRYAHHRLTRRATAVTMPRWQLIDMRRERPESGLSKPLIDAIKTALSKEEQVLIFLNRRGFSPVLLCLSCGYSATCQHCSTRLIYHQRENKLRCHHCDAIYRPETQCPSCHAALTPTGFGTERVESALSDLFPDTEIVRIDRDTTRNKHALEQKLLPAYAGRSQILLGTQMLAKGHHFPKVNLVALLNIDSSLYSMDFRALERLGQLITQVAGRAGRESDESQVYLQTLNPDNDYLRFLLKEGYHSFAKRLLKERKLAQLPPYQSLCLIKAQHKSQAQCLDFLGECKQRLSNTVESFGPTPAPIEKKAGLFRGQLLLQSPSRQALHHAIKQLINTLPQKISASIKWTIDVDPQDFS